LFKEKNVASVEAFNDRKYAQFYLVAPKYAIMKEHISGDQKEMRIGVQVVNR